MEMPPEVAAPPIPPLGEPCAEVNDPAALVLQHRKDIQDMKT